jgi:hypothetical protein
MSEKKPTKGYVGPFMYGWILPIPLTEKESRQSKEINRAWARSSQVSRAR